MIACILLLLFSITVWAQESAMITGVVTDENKEPLIGVNIAIQNMPGLGVITDINGRYKIKASAYDRLVFSYIGYETVVVLVKEQKTINVKMKEAANTIIDEVVITGTGAQKKIAVTGAITNVDVDALKSLCKLLDDRVVYLSFGFVVYLLLVLIRLHWYLLMDLNVILMK